MTARARGVAVLAVQLALVLSIAVKYAWERHECPRVWTRAAQVDPEQPLRGRYLALTLDASACGLPPGRADHAYGRNSKGEWASFAAHTWDVLPVARDGKLSAVVVDGIHPDAKQLTVRNNQPCDYATLSGTTEFFIAENATQPFPLAKGEDLWAEVTVPPSGPPRPIQLAVSDGRNFRVLHFR